MTIAVERLDELCSNILAGSRAKHLLLSKKYASHSHFKRFACYHNVKSISSLPYNFNIFLKFSL